MTESGKVVTAIALSVLAHVALFTVLALMPEPTRVPVTPPQDDPPLEVTIQPPQEEAGQVPLNPLPPEPPQAHGVQTQLDPENLKKAAQAPEHPTDIAAHDSQATPAQSQNAPAPTSEPDSALALQPVAPSPAKDADAPGIDAIGNYSKAVGNAIGARWEFYRKKYYLAVGVVHLKIAIDAQGQVGEVRVLSNSAQPSNATCAIRAVKEAKIPPISAERLAQVPGGRLEIEYTFISTP
jgi:outer membrane biosynthesis protein TonB